ncbi:hypothetical protein MP228_013069 [Amoeboaphelidium protococcarum]|nr:hypothetical protein MP228_013069 [Amoeboaphelidium protococcarum]
MSAARKLMMSLKRWHSKVLSFLRTLAQLQWFSGFTPSDNYLLSVFLKDYQRKKYYYDLEVQIRGGKVLSVDHSYKWTKHLMQVDVDLIFFQNQNGHDVEEDYCKVLEDVDQVKVADAIDIKHKLEDVVRDCFSTGRSYRRAYLNELIEDILQDEEQFANN